MARRRASCWTPRAREIVMMAGRPSGTAATAKPMAAEMSSAGGEAVDEAPDQQHDGGHAEDGEGEGTSEGRELAGQRGVEGVLAGRGDEAADPPDLRPGPCPGDDTDALAPRDDGAGEEHRGAVPDAGVRLGGGGVLGRGDSLPGEGGLLDAQHRGGEQPQVGRHPVARSHRHHVAGDEEGGIEVRPLPVPTHARPCLHHRADRVERVQGLALLDEADDRVDQCDGEDHRGVHPVAHDGLEHGGREQDVDEDVVEVGQEPAQGTRPGRVGQLIATRGRQPLLRLRLGQSLIGDPEFTQDLLGGGATRLPPHPCHRSWVPVGRWRSSCTHGRAPASPGQVTSTGGGPRCPRCARRTAQSRGTVPSQSCHPWCRTSHAISA